MALNAWDEQQQYRDHLAAVARAGARIGRSTHRISSRGAGEIRIQQPISLRVTFIEEPTFTSGVSLNGGRLIDGAYPLVTVGVYSWRKDSRGFYTGAWLWVAVDVAKTEIVTGTVDPLVEAERALVQAQAVNKLTLSHHLCFEGMALRDIDYDQVMAD